MLLSELEPGQNAIVESVGGSGSIRRHLLDMGLTPNALVTLQKIAPMGDPIQIGAWVRVDPSTRRGK